MKKYGFCFLILALLLSLFTCAVFAAGTDGTSSEEIFPDFSAPGAELLEDADVPIAETAAEYHAMWDKFVEDGFAIRENLGDIEGEPLYAYLFTFDTVRMRPNDRKEDTKPASIDENNPFYFQKRRILFTSGMHGNEKAAPAGLYKIFYHLCYDISYAKYRAFDYYVIPLANPTGYNVWSRNNYQDININRDAFDQVTPEGTLISDFISKRNYELFVDWHQTSQGKDREDVPQIGFFSQSFPNAPQIEQQVNEAFSIAANLTERAANAVYGKPLNTQACFCWNGEYDSGTYRNFCRDYAKASCCFESYMSCTYYTGDTSPFNEGALRLGYTLQVQTFRSLMDLVLYNASWDLLPRE